MSTEVPPPDSPETPGWVGDPKAKLEQKFWGNDEKLQSAKTMADVLWVWAYAAVVILFLFVFSVLFLGSLASWAAHYLLPSNFHWLSGEQLSKIQSVLFSGSIGGVVSLIAQKQLTK